MTDSELAKVLKQIKEDISAIKTQNAQIIQQNSDVKDELKSFKKITIEEVEKLKSENEQLKNENTLIKSKLQEIERKSKKYNLVIYGLKEEAKEYLIGKVITILSQKLEVQLESSGIRDAYRIGKRTDNSTRPIVLELVNHASKWDILGKTGKLKGTGITITSDYIAEDYGKQRYLVSQLKVEREKGRSAKIRGNSLIVEGNHYSYEELKKRNIEEVEVSSGEKETIKEKNQSKENRKNLRSNVKAMK